MHYQHSIGVVTGGASGLGLATARRRLAKGMQVVIAVLPRSPGAAVAAELGAAAHFVAADVSSDQQMTAVFDTARSLGPVRALVHCAGRGGPLRLLDRDGKPGSLADRAHQGQPGHGGAASAEAGPGRRVRRAGAAYPREPHAQRRDHPAGRRVAHGAALNRERA